jgi:hypothetical protein
VAEDMEQLEEWLEDCEEVDADALAECIQINQRLIRQVAYQSKTSADISNIPTAKLQELIDVVDVTFGRSYPYPWVEKLKKYTTDIERIPEIKRLRVL